MLHSTCANCDAPLSGPYCSQCGQHVHDSARTLGALLHDGWHVLTHLDGRFWGTMGLLLLRPGRLTVEYFAARRARYVPPVRLYLVLSIVVLALASATSDVATPGKVAPKAGVVAAAGVDEDTDAADAGSTPGKGGPATGPAVSGPTDRRAEDNLDLGALGRWASKCENVRSSSPWVQNALRAGCERAARKSSAEVLHALRANLPRMMFVFLPLMALVMSFMYWFPRRYYVEHLVFFLHNHAALYLAMSLEILVGVLARFVPALAPLGTVGVVILCLYAPWYVYRSMRTFYGQGRALTLFKIGVVSFAYLVFLVVTGVLTLLYSVYFA